MKIFVYLGFLCFVLSVSAQQYDPLEGVFSAKSDKRDGEESPKRKQKNLAEWMELNLAYAPAGGYGRGDDLACLSCLGRS